jgi:hypothetical protein
MKLAFEPRASTVLYHILSSRSDKRPFLLPANTSPNIALTFLKTGIPFEFVDISPVTLHMDLELAAAQLDTGKFGGLLYAHTFGETSTPVGFFAKYADMLTIIDDRHTCPPDAHPSLESSAQITLYSTGPGQVVDLGFGGYAFLADDVPYHPQHLPFIPQTWESLKKDTVKHLLERTPFEYVDSPWLQTDRPMPQWKDYFRAMADVHLLTMRQRMSVNAVYAANLPGDFQFTQNYQLWRFNLNLPEKKRYILPLAEANIPIADPLPSLAGVFAPGSCPEAEKLASQTLQLFNDERITPDIAEKACEVVLKHRT